MKQTLLLSSNKLYQIFIDQREIHLCVEFWAKTKFHVTDQIGFVLYYSQEQEDTHQITDEFIRRHLVMMNRCVEYVIASSKESAIQILSKKLEGLAIGGESSRSKAQQIVTDDIREIPLCPYLKKATKGDYEGEFMCHFLDKNGKQLEECFGGCWISGYDAPSFCPITYSDQEKKYIMKMPTQI